MNLMEYQGKDLFRRVGIPVPRSRHAPSADDVGQFIEESAGDWVVKAQVLMGGRGKAGKIKFAKSGVEGRQVAKEILATPMPPNRQNPAGEPVNSLLVEEKLPIAQEAYCAIAIDRSAKKPVLMVSRFGGMDIEEVAEKHPDSIAKFYADTAIGYSPFIGRELAFAAKLDPGYRKQLPAIAGALYDLFFRYGAKLVEINPLVLTSDGRVFASDAKVELDDDALFRNPEAAQWQQSLPLDEDERLALKAGVGIRNFRRFDGTVGTMANGAGLAMATMDAVSIAGGKIANFLDVGGGANAERVRNCYELVVNNTGARVFFINIFGGITRGDEVARGIVLAMTETASRKIPLVIRLTGTNEEEGRRILAQAGMTPVETMDEGAKRAVEIAAKG
ncbi:MAG: ADP-forming succinate--CoA ligase subunit beta [Candidatus Eremiobacteraeota bacterium]|nr:ADP-forming succinate--CoA ligase subunit beta [Candidatus Eremiobacteraeota bacterium]MBV8375160.1 ADP-forming succinate--CoA ligase subunit beta [Candidatus Eremiobacteraeota bacterium]